MLTASATRAGFVSHMGKIGHGVTQSADADDQLNDGWKIGVYGAALIPYGSWFVVIGTSVLYYAWRKDYPNKAAAINRHGWLAWLLGTALWAAAWFLMRN